MAIEDADTVRAERDFLRDYVRDLETEISRLRDN